MIQSVLMDIFTIQNLIWINIGMMSGIIMGALPGLTATMGVALLLPLTYGIGTVPGILMLLGVYCGGTYGGSITAILIKTPGTPASAATMLDGNALAEQGKAGTALEAALKSSMIGGIISCIALLFFAPIIAKAALAFGPAEMFSLAVFGLTIIVGVIGKSPLKGLIGAAVGLMLSTIGLDPIGGLPRMTFGITRMTAGIQLVPALIGLFAISELMEKITKKTEGAEKPLSVQKDSISWRELLKYKLTLLKSSIIGVIIGAIPGTGPALAAFLSYNEAKRTSKHPEEFGNGSIEGVAASEAANNGVTGATLIPLLTLGIPGDTVTAVLLGALTLKGLTPGPRLFEVQAELVYTVITGLLLVNIFMFLQGKLFIKAFIKIIQVPEKLLIPLIAVLCSIGSFALNNSSFDVIVMVLFGVLGYVMSKFDIPKTAVIIAFILGPMAETNFRRALIGANNMVFFQKPISLLFLFIAFFSLCWPMLQRRISRRKIVKAK